MITAIITQSEIPKDLHKRDLPTWIYNKFLEKGIVFNVPEKQRYSYKDIDDGLNCCGLNYQYVTTVGCITIHQWEFGTPGPPNSEITSPDPLKDK